MLILNQRGKKNNKNKNFILIILLILIISYGIFEVLKRFENKENYTISKKENIQKNIKMEIITVNFKIYINNNSMNLN